MTNLPSPLQMPDPSGNARDLPRAFRYEEMPLDPGRKEIRLLHMERWSDPDQPGNYQIILGIEVVSLLDDPPPKYKALSYLWQEIFRIPDAIRWPDLEKEPNGNLKMAIKELSCTEEGALWVDAVCVNQNDDAEKQRQVSMMSEIYSSAEEVITWLGNESQAISQALVLVENLGGFCETELARGLVSGCSAS